MKQIVNKKILTSIMLFLIMALSFIVGFACLNGFKSVSAESNLDTLGINFGVKGASVRYTKESPGLRFEAGISEKDFDNLTKYASSKQGSVNFGMVILPADYISDPSKEINEETMFGKNAIYCWNGKQEGKKQILNFESSELYLDKTDIPEYVMRCAITNIFDKNLVRDFYAKTYIEIKTDSNSEYKFFDSAKENSDTRSIAYVSQILLKKEQSAEHKAVLENFVSRAKENNQGKFSYREEFYFQGDDGLYSKDNNRTIIKKGKNLDDLVSAESPMVINGKVLSKKDSVISGKVLADNSLVLKSYYNIPETKDYNGRIEISKLNNYNYSNESAKAEIQTNPQIDVNDVVAVYSGNEEVKTVIKNGNIEIDISSFPENSEQILKIYTSNSVYNTKLFIASYIIRNKEDLSDAFTKFNLCGEKQSFVLMNNIDATGVTITGVDTAKLMGTLDGNGYVVNNLTVKNYLLSQINDGKYKDAGQYASIRNISFENLKLDVNEKFSGLILKVRKGTVIDNCYFDINLVNSFDGTYSAGLIRQVAEREDEEININKTLVKLSASNISGGKFVQIGTLVTNNFGQLSLNNTYAIGDKAYIFKNRNNGNTQKGVVKINNKDAEILIEGDINSFDERWQKYVFSNNSQFKRTKYASDFVDQNWYKSTTKIINNAEEFKAFGSINGPVEDDYVLGADIDLSGIVFEGYSNNFNFKGVLNGNNHTIKNLRATNSFINYFTDGVIENISFENMVIEIPSGSKNLGGFIMTATGISEIRNAYFDIKVENHLKSSLVGGLVRQCGTNNPEDRLTITDTIVKFNFVHYDGGSGEMSVFVHKNHQPLYVVNSYGISGYRMIYHNMSSTANKGYVNIKNGQDAVVEVNTQLSEFNAPWQKYVFKDFATFNASVYATNFSGEMWNNILGK